MSETTIIRPVCDRCGFQCDEAHPVEDFSYDGWTIAGYHELDATYCDECSQYLGL